jgi:lysophospholipase L1-like esterase/antitoxin (DNA-binding transcriptional repressor) of toxin-antitoxin stability system
VSARLLLATLLLALFSGLAGHAPAQQPALALSADTRERGYIDLRLRSTPGVQVTISEGTQPIAELTPTEASTSLRRAATWLCDRRVREFTATSADGQSASAEVRTPSCARRLALRAPRGIRSGRSVQVRLVDRWRLGGFTARLCVEPPGGPADCRRQRIGRRGEPARFRALRPGGWLVEARTPYGRAERLVRARKPGGGLSLLATGDSMIQIIDGYLKARLGPRGVRVRSDAHISTGISKPSLLDWEAQARRQAASRPDVVVMFLGANDGFPMGDAACCNNDAWIAEYARRAGRMMASYGRGGRTRVYWLLLPTPRGGFFRETFPAVNSGIRRAAARARRDVRVIDLVEVFTPGGRYRDSMPVGGRLRRVRQGDGVHLNTTGASVAANVIIRTLRRERILR